MVYILLVLIGAFLISLLPAYAMFCILKQVIKQRDTIREELRAKEADQQEALRNAFLEGHFEGFKEGREMATGKVVTSVSGLMN